ncbi:hypothetical protein T265_11162 [Opisthorchis viverrini]|uniref:Uncharacterized protein n=1 Tax=Opisthorchis viverrini TaxID=6198 RepID=A0A074Z407_OPIVI|nr:hypothetical protein T265_11162 [Opisthorchis viverrini]KER20237.1 hypothetical protein T265_11162 [Opisthorchis viverrini]
MPLGRVSIRPTAAVDYNPAHTFCCKYVRKETQLRPWVRQKSLEQLSQKSMSFHILAPRKSQSKAVCCYVRTSTDALKHPLGQETMVASFEVYKIERLPRRQLNFSEIILHSTDTYWPSGRAHASTTRTWLKATQRAGRRKY